MRIGSFWGLTAPMFVIAFPEPDDALKLFTVFNETSNGDILKDLQKELIQLQRVSSYMVYNSRINLSEDYPDLFWRMGGVADTPELNAAITREITEKVLAKVLNNEIKGKFVDATDLEGVVEKYLATNSFQLKRIAKAVTEIINTLPKATVSNNSKWLQQYPLNKSIADTVIVKGKRHTLTADEKAILEYFMSRLDDVDTWIKALGVTKVEEDEIFGIPFSNLVRRKPESIRYAVLNLFEQVKHTGNAKMLEKVIANVRKDSDKMKECYRRFVGVRGEDVIEEGVSQNVDVDASFFTTNELLMKAGFSWSALSKRDKEILLLAYEGVCRVTPSALNETFGVKVTDWTAYGKELCDTVRICGLNGCAEQLFVEAVCNTVLAVNKIYRDEETIAKVDSILRDDIDALTETYLAVGEVIPVE